MNDYQLIVIGAGPGGYTSALHAAKLGLRTAVVEKDLVGGTCLNRGCVPTKALLHASEVYREALDGAKLGVVAQSVQLDLARMFARKREITEKLRQGILSLFKSAKIDCFTGVGTVVAPHTVRIACEGEEMIRSADHILVATGSVPAKPPIPGLELSGVLTSDTLLEGCDRLYRSIAVIGGGVIGVELATFYNELGSEVTIIEGLDRLLPNMDRELGQSLALLLKKRGIRIFTGATVRQIERVDNTLSIRFETKKGTETVQAETALCAVGRSPNLQDVFADGLLPEKDGRRLCVDTHYQTSIPHVYAVGDVSSKVQLAHVAAAQGVACVDMLLGRQSDVAMEVVPSCVYCHPEIASVGMTEQEAKEAGIPVKSAKCTLFGNARTLIADEDRSFMKLVVHADDRRLLGAQLMCRNSTDMISQLSLAIANRMTVEQLRKVMRPHPTFEEALQEALEKL